MKGAIDAFEQYVKQFDFTNKLISLKYHHTYRMVEDAIILAKRIGLSQEDTELLEKCALLHDIGRFYQVEVINSFWDKELDHASYGVKYLFEDGKIKLYEQDKTKQEIIKEAVYYHNKHVRQIPKLESGVALFVSLVRDLDKIDIFKVYSEEIPMTFNQNELDLDYLKQFDDKKSIYTSKEKKKTKSDSFLVACSFIYDINYKESYRLLKEKGYLDTFFDKVVVDDASVSLFEQIKKAIYQKLEEEVKC